MYNAITTQRASLQDDTSLDLKQLLANQSQKGSDKQLLKTSKQVSNESAVDLPGNGTKGFTNLTQSSIG